MSRKYLVILSMLVVVPLLVFMWLGQRLVSDEEARTQRQIQELHVEILANSDRTIANLFRSIEQTILARDLDEKTPEELRDILRSEPIFEQILILDHDGNVTYPDPLTASGKEEEFLQKVAQLIDDRSLVRLWHARQSPSSGQQGANSYLSNAQQLDPSPAASNQQVSPPPPNQRISRGFARREKQNTEAMSNSAWSEVELQADHGWYRWYWGKGLQLIHWRGLVNGNLIAVSLPRAKWISEVISILPDSQPTDGKIAAPAQIRLVDAEGRPVYLWGEKTLPEDARPVATLNLSEPLQPWELQHFGPANPSPSGTSLFAINLLAAGGVLGIGLLGLAFYLSREIGRQMREAKQRVSFVNQVSHELKTPLTNIRMYAELLEKDLDRLDLDADDRARTRISVINNESSRLGRLINNVLSFARLRREANPVRPQTAIVDQVVAQVVDQFRPVLDRLGIDVALDLDAPRTALLDVDALEQMLGNLISNVEKYAVSGKYLGISTQQSDDRTSIQVSDRGPGIPGDFSKRIFEPFERAADHLESATGTGIGLAITRELARRHGGDLRLVGSPSGASFRLDLRTPFTNHGNTSS